jgi:hypothetical protein
MNISKKTSLIDSLELFRSLPYKSSADTFLCESTTDTLIVRGKSTLARYYDAILVFNNEYYTIVHFTLN